ncbi:phosphatidylinositol-3,4,5-trisphosphate 3-phosphatase and dual-specificity protein phosphatase PTEN [Entomortierella parvispora]|uniref:Phosphatidylinositol 3,4,5-trisphosphate 3-phosphatase and dual-specificity protein phosphatase PTEN n=1 Tax=Entomortierella parvispora TaxID=205924 RepID=A0A9P3M1W7_9FUNG|nr:phosphatidylinositol-3,4,5-trisphosphate 3-phosphatase and dual-specificity protein phosphatase PTEN [Entomortierella parvispora]
MNLLRHAVSKQKRRFVDKESGMDLDLAYITPLLIAMGYPSKALEAFYRNPMSDVEKFLDSRHAGAYKVYNLCSEKSYSDLRFHGRVAQFPFHDHSPPPFQLIHPFCEDVSDWLHTVEGNVVAIHCKAGKGRTGVMICSFLVHCGSTAEDAIKLYGEKRTHDGCGVTIPSQLRYIRYYEQFLESRTLNYDPRLLALHEIVFNTIPKPLLNLEQSSSFLILTIMSNDIKIYESVPQHCCVDYKLQQIRISITDKIVLAGDVKMMLWYDSLYKRCHLCHFHFNTTFIDPIKNTLFLTKSEVDKACKDKLHSIFDKNMSIQVNFQPALAQQSPLPTLDSLPNRAILLKYKSPEGPNSVQVSPPYFSTLKLAPPRNSTSLAAFSIGGPLTVDRTNANGTSSSSGNGNTTSGKVGVVGEGQRTTPPNSSGSAKSSGSNSSSSHTSNGITPIASPVLSPNMRSPVLMHSKAAFKPVWDKDRDRDDNWDASSISSDYSEADSSLEWWYTEPPRPTLHSTTGTAATASSASIAQPEHTVRADRETSSLIICESTPSSAHSSTGKEEPTANVMTSLTGHLLRSALGGIGGGGGGNGVGGNINSGVSSVGPCNITPPNSASAYRGLPHSATSPLAREIKFDSNSLISSPRISPSQATGAYSPMSGNQAPEKDPQELDLAAPNVLPREDKWEKSSVGGSFLNEDGDTIHEDERGDSGVESLKDAKEDGLCPDQERGWVGSMSRWFWSADGTRIHEQNRPQ